MRLSPSSASEARASEYVFAHASALFLEIARDGFKQTSIETLRSK